MRDFAVDLEKQFLKLTRREPNLYSDPNSILVEQFVKGIEDRFLRNLCRDMYDRRHMENFRNLREFPFRRAGQEHAGSRRPEEVGHAAVQLRNDRKVSDTDILKAIETMTNKVVGTLHVMGRQV